MVHIFCVVNAHLIRRETNVFVILRTTMIFSLHHKPNGPQEIESPWLHHGWIGNLKLKIESINNIILFITFS